jgi:lipopolysaccharide/colanic/teichoic acid biosynthesis glycosyltransferase
VRIDLEYIAKRSLGLDLQILLLTPWVMITGKGAH